MILRAAGLLVRLRAQRLYNLLSVGRRRKAAGVRSGTARRVGWMLPAVVVVVNLLGAVMLSWTSIQHARVRLDGFTRHHAVVTSLPLGEAVETEVMLLVALACGVALLMSLGTRELANPDWDMEWLATLPLPLSQLLGVRLCERVLLNPVGLITLWPLLSVSAFYQGARWLSPVAGLLVTLPLLMLVGTLHLLADTGLRLRLTPPRLRNLQAVCGLAGLVGLYLMLSAGQSQSSLVHDWAAALPAWFRWLPPGLAVRALTPQDLPVVLLSLLALYGMAALFALSGLLLLRWLLRDGLLTAGARESSRSAPRPAARGRRGPRRLVTALQARELKLLARDHAFLVQTLVLPVVILGAQFFFNMRVVSDLSDPRHLGAVAFAVMAYAMLFSTFQTLAAEGHALWLLFTFPRPLDSLLREKARLWSVVSLVFPAAVFAVGLSFADKPGWHTAAAAALVVAAVPIFATIGTCLGVLGWDPLALDQRRRVRPGWAWLYMLLASMFTYALYARSWWTSAVLVTLTAALALSLWQRVRDRLPYLLDAGASPPARVSLSDGMLAALLFFVLQAALVAILLEALGSEAELGRVMLLAYALAGALTFGILRTAFALRRTGEVPRYSGGEGRPLVTGLLLGAAGALVSAGWVTGMRRFGFFQAELDASVTALHFAPVSMALLAVLAAPVFEEFLFRGLVFGGLRRSQGFVSAALTSSAIFAVVHPPPSLVPVFLLGMLAAVARERTGTLLAPVLVHAGFNAASVAAQLLA